MTNFIKITDSKQLDQLFETIQDKLIILMFFTKSNPECKRALNHFERSASSHTTSYFFVIDMDKFQGESRYTKNIQLMPKFEFYFSGNPMGGGVAFDDKEIERLVQNAERYVMTTNNMKNMNNINQNNTMPYMNQFTPMQIQQMQQQILNNLQMQNPTQARYLMQNPTMLQQMAQNQLMQQMQPMQQMQQMQQMQPMQQQMSGQMPFMSQPMTSIPMMQQPSIPISSPIQPVLSTTSTTSNLTPTFQQMQQMFQIFQMMQQMGIINPTAQPTIPDIQKQNMEETVLPNGDKIISLANGKYGLIKAKQIN